MLSFIPHIINSDVKADILSVLLKERTVVISGEIDDDLATLVNLQLLYLDSEGQEDITLYLCSPGGSVSAGMAIIDMIAHVKSDVVTIAAGDVASMAAIILAAGTKGKRYGMPHAQIMLHQPSGAFSGKEDDIQIAAKHIAKLKDSLVEILSEKTGRTHEELIASMEKDCWLNASQAIEAGVIDAIL